MIVDDNINNYKLFYIKTKKANGIKMTGHRLVYKSDRSLACLEVANSLSTCAATRPKYVEKVVEGDGGREPAI